MTELVYYCLKDKNNCPKREECKRYIDSENKECRTSLFKMACTENNGYVLFIKKEGEE